MKQISICMTHFQRRSQLRNTLKSIQNQGSYKDLVEIIIVDDVSSKPLTYQDVEDFDLDIKLITVQTNNKWWINPCVSFNTAFNYISAPKVIIQNAECLHATNVLEYVLQKLEPNLYVAMSTLALSREATDRINTHTSISEIDTSNSSWYCHSNARPQPFNFCAALYTLDLFKVGCFDRRFSKGIYYDDDAFLHSIRESGIQTKIEDNQLVYHQWHEQIWEALPNKHELGAINRQLLNSL